MNAHAHLMTLLWRGQTREIALFRDGVASVGRARGADIPVDDRTVDRLHALIEWAPDGPTIRDIGSANGTSVNGLRLEPGRPCLLLAEDEIAVGTTLIRLVRCERPAPPAPCRADPCLARARIDPPEAHRDCGAAPGLLPVNLSENAVRFAASLLVMGLAARTADGGLDIGALSNGAWRALYALCPEGAERLTAKIDREAVRR